MEMNQERQNQQQPRGRGRGRGTTRRNFGSSVTRNSEENKNIEKKQQINEVKNQEPKAVDSNKKENLIEKGKAWLSKHFNGLTKQERGNVRVTLNRQIDFELYSLYESRLKNIISSQKVYEKSAVLGAQRMLKPLISTMIGIKLLKANTQYGKANMVRFKGLSDIDFRAPGNLINLIENFGKSDAINDNVIRINYQNAVIKQKFFDAIVDFACDDDEFDHSNFQFTEGTSIESLKEYVDKYLKGNDSLRLYDESVDSIEMINAMGKDAVNQLNNTEIGLKLQEKDVKIRLPYLKPEDTKRLESVLAWGKQVSDLFGVLDITVDQWRKVLALSLVSWMPLRFIQNRKSSFSTIDSRFNGTIFADATPNEILVELNFYPMETFMTNEQLHDNMINLINIYRVRYEKIFEMAFNMKDFKPTEYGSSAQIVEGHTMTSRYIENSNLYDGKVQVVANDTRVTSKLKMKDDEALIGLSFKFSTRVDIDSNYILNYSNSTQQIRLDYVMKDFKN